MSTWQKICRLRHQMATAAAEPCAYKSWRDGFVRRELNKLWQQRWPDVSPFTEADFRALTQDQIREVFGNWDGELALIPLWLRPWVKDGQTVTDIFGKEKVLTEETDLDHRGGYVAFGWKIWNLRP